jgi:hypothetical protein
MTQAGRLSREAAEFTYPDPQTDETLAGVSEHLTEVENRAAAFEALGLSSSEIRVAGYAEAAQRYLDLAKSVGLHAISENDLSQVKMAKAMNVAPLTIARWVKDAREKDQSS